MFKIKARAYPSGAPETIQNRLLALPANIRLGWKCLPGTNTLAYFVNTAPTVTVVINSVWSVFVSALHIHPSLIFADSVGAYPSGAPYRTLYIGCRLKSTLIVAKPLVYYNYSCKKLYITGLWSLFCAKEYGQTKNPFNKTFVTDAPGK
jgi:hypothetical protein